MWILYSILSSFCETGKDVIGKNVSGKTNEYAMSISLQLFAAVALLPFVIAAGIPHLAPAFWITFFYGSLFSLPAWSILYMKGVKLSPLSVSIPMLSFNPIFVAFFGLIFEGKLPGPLGWTGIILISAGLYLSRLNRETIKKNIFLPILSLKDEPGALCMLGVALIWGIGAYVAKISSSSSSPLFSSFSSCAASAPILYLIARWRKQNVKIAEIKNNFLSLFSLGVLNGFSEYFWKTSAVLGPVPYAASIKRMNMIWSSLFGRVVFQERLGKARLIGIFLMFAGVIFLVVFK